MSCLETVHVGWRAGGGLDDMAVAPSFNQLVGVCISNSLITTYVVDVKSCIPFTANYSDNIAESNKNVCVQSTQLNTTSVNTSTNYRDNDNSNSIPTIHPVQQICGNSNLANYMQVGYLTFYYASISLKSKIVHISNIHLQIYLMNYKRHFMKSSSSTQLL